MRKELQNKLFDDFPLLYGDRTKPMTQTCMCWGICTGDGWYDIIRELSEKLESMISDFAEKNPKVSCRVCGCKRDKHYASASYNPTKCLAIKREYDLNKIIWLGRKVAWYKVPLVPFIKLYNWYQRTFNSELYSCWCEQYDPMIPRASQVKEKYGTLRFYMDLELNGMHELIMEAENKSASTCEECGKPGKMRDGGWLKVRCDACDDK